MVLTSPFSAITRRDMVCGDPSPKQHGAYLDASGPSLSVSGEVCIPYAYVLKLIPCELQTANCEGFLRDC